MKVKESLNVPFDESPPPTKLSPLVDDDGGEEKAIKKNTKVVNNNNEEDESIEVDEIVNIKDSKYHPLDQVIGNLNQITLRRSFFPPNSTIPRRSKKQTTNVVEPEFRTIVTMAENRTVAQMLQAPIEGYEDAIVVPQINANNFELKQTLISLVQSNQFTGRQDPHNHLRFFNKLDKEPPRSILTWEDLVSKFINQIFPPSKTTYLRNEITNFLKKPNEIFNEAWERFKDLLRQCPQHGFLELHQLDTFYNALNPNDQDALDSAPGGNFLDKIP
nr:reverse transcriptase domain-containing protein [Tanacetum cinerariifolium]